MKHISGSALFYVFAVFFIFVWINCFKKGNISVSRFIKHSPYSLIWQIGITKKTSKSYKNSLVKGDKKGKKKKKKTVNIVANGMQTFKIMKDKGWLNIEKCVMKFVKVSCHSFSNHFWNVFFFIFSSPQICLGSQKPSTYKVCSDYKYFAPKV